MIKIIYNLCFLLTLTSFSLFAQGEDPMAPSIHKLNQEELEERLRPKVSTEFEYFMNTDADSIPIVLKRDKEHPAKLHIKGRGSLNHIEIYAKPEDEYPILSRTFRGVHFEFIDLAQLEDGDYQLRIISNHRDTETKLSITTLEEK